MNFSLTLRALSLCVCFRLAYRTVTCITCDKLEEVGKRHRETWGRFSVSARAVSMRGWFLPPVPVLPIFMDLPLIGSDDVAYAPWMAVAAKPWPGTVALMSSVSGSGYELNTLFPGGATFGVTLSELKRGPVGVKNRSAVLTVKLSTGGLSSTTWEDVLNGSNLAVIGDGSAENWELIQFEEASLVAPDTWELKGFLRGQKGSDGLMPQDWPAKSLFVLMNGAP